MTVEDELQAKVDALAGKINQVKQNQHPQYTHLSPPAYRGASRWSPYRAPGRGGFKNRTLVIAGNGAGPLPATSTPSSHGAAADGYVSMSGRNKQLMTQKTFDRETKQKVESTGKQAVAPHNARHEHQKYSRDSPNGSWRELELDTIRFRMRPDGSKLVRVGDDASPKETPKQVIIAGVTFLRTKQGNLARATASDDRARNAKRVQCQHFTRHGTCPFGPSCKFAHDPSKIAICRDFLRSGSCPRGDNCDLSHEPTYHRAPACAHFLRGNCTNNACRYPHVHVSPAASVCRAFATLGFCARGPDCDKRHVTECPDYANRGHCANRESGQCKLPHPDHASTLRKAELRQAKIDAGGVESDLSSDDEQQSDDDMIVDVLDDDDDDAVVTTGSDDESHELSQQQDFVAFS